MKTMKDFHLYLDLDGVFADFVTGCVDQTGLHPDTAEDSDLWDKIRATPNFFRNLPLMHDALELWAFCKVFGPTVLTAVPPEMQNTKSEKNFWVEDSLHPNPPVITCQRIQKQDYSKPGTILVDDRVNTKAEWESRGGIFVLHTSARNSIRQLKALGL